ncbi:MAG TPA: tetratricopeptide repeat protein, partial [Anaeromyxobacteraceae bacterium]|nr:tetratricopeptide repeat protein [Anaeromyxobacteraceae bacterium]
LEDPALEAYLMSVARKIQSPAAWKAVPFRIKVLRNFRPNAFALPNGAVYLHTGILARMDSEAELATLLGHEMTHATHRHAARELASASNWGAALAGINVATLGLATPLGALAAGAAVSGHGRDLEREADRVGMELVAAAGYELADAPKLFQHLLEWTKEEKEEDDESFFFASHPRLEERLESTQDLLAGPYRGRTGGVRNADVFRHKTLKAVIANGRLDLAAGRRDAARRDAQRVLAVDPRYAPAHAVLGEAARQRDEQGDLDEAVAHYRRALALDPRLAPAWRGLGLALFKKGDRKGARPAFSRYLELEPAAADRGHVKDYLARCGH